MSRFYSNTFTNEIVRSKLPPVYNCSICCRLLYKDELHNLNRDWELYLIQEMSKVDMKWPLLYYKDCAGNEICSPPRDNRGLVITCASHRSGGYNAKERLFKFVSVFSFLSKVIVV